MPAPEIRGHPGLKVYQVLKEKLVFKVLLEILDLQVRKGKLVSKALPVMLDLLVPKGRPVPPEPKAQQIWPDPQFR